MPNRRRRFERHPVSPLPTRIRAKSRVRSCRPKSLPTYGTAYLDAPRAPQLATVTLLTAAAARACLDGSIILKNARTLVDPYRRAAPRGCQHWLPAALATNRGLRRCNLLIASTADAYRAPVLHPCCFIVADDDHSLIRLEFRATVLADTRFAQEVLTEGCKLAPRHAAAFLRRVDLDVLSHRVPLRICNRLRV